MVKWIIPKLKEEEARQPGAWRDLWRGLISGDGQELPEAVKRVESIGEGPARLELWRVRDVGGEAEPILLGLREVVAFHEPGTPGEIERECRRLLAAFD